MLLAARMSWRLSSRPLVTDEETTKPIVTIQITREGATPGQGLRDQDGDRFTAGRAEQTGGIDFRGHPGSGHGGLGRRRSPGRRMPSTDCGDSMRVAIFLTPLTP